MTAITLTTTHLIIYIEKPGISYSYPKASIVLA
jgi:hypothetical protein